MKRKFIAQTKMEKSSIYKFYKLGHLLSEFKAGASPKNFELHNRITNFLDSVDELNLKITVSAIKLGGLKNLQKELEGKHKDNPKDVAQEDLVRKVNREIDKLLLTFEAEILYKNTFISSDKKFSVEQLIDDPTKLFAKEKVLLDSTFEVKYNIMEGAKCLAFDRNTAAAFHMLLATEQYVQFFNNHFFEDEENFEEEIFTFFEKIKETEVILRDLKHSSELVGLLHILRKYYRNQSQHADRKFTESEATDLFTICIKVINELHLLLEKNELIKDN